MANKQDGKNENNKNNRRVKLGAISVSYTVIFIAVIVALNTLITAIGDNVNTKIDVSGKDYYNVTDASKVIINSLGAAVDVDIYFLADRDLLEGSASEKVAMVHEMAREYARLYPDNIRISYKDVDHDKKFLEKYYTEYQTTLSSSNIIFEGRYHTRVLGFNAFFLFNDETGDIYAFQGELKMTSVIVQTSLNEHPTAVFTTGHGETLKARYSTSTDTENAEYGTTEYNVTTINDVEAKQSLIASVPLLEILDNSGFDVVALDLTKEEIPESARVVIVSNPQSDFEGYTIGDKTTDPNIKTEINKLSAYVDKYKSLAVIVGSSTPALPNLSELLWDEYGLGYEASHVVRDMDNCVLTGTEGNGFDGYSVVGEYLKGENSLEYVVTETVSPSKIKTVFREAVKLKVRENWLGAAASMVSSSTSEIVYSDEVVETGSVPLLAVFCEMHYGKDNVLQYKRVFMFSSDDFLAPSYAGATFGNSMIMYSCARAMSNEAVVPKDVEYIKFQSEALNAETVTSDVARNWTIILTAIAPVLIFIAGGIVWFRRRRY